MSTHAPYATLHDLPKYEKRADAVEAPWFKDQETVKCARGHDPVPYVACNSRTAPFATFHNIPNSAEVIISPIFFFLLVRRVSQHLCSLYTFF